MPSGNTVTKLDAVPWVAVTFSTTAVTPDAGTPFFPVTCRLTVCPAPTGPVIPPVPLRVSITRTGPAGVSSDPAGAVIETAGSARLFTVTLTGLEVVVLPAVSTARAVIVWVPFPAVVESQLRV